MKYRVQITAKIFQNYTVEAEDKVKAEEEALDLFNGETPLEAEDEVNVEIEEIA